MYFYGMVTLRQAYKINGCMKAVLFKAEISDIIGVILALFTLLIFIVILWNSFNMFPSGKDLIFVLIINYLLVINCSEHSVTVIYSNSPTKAV